MTTADKLRALLADGWTQSAIAAKTNIPQGTISRIATGKHSDPRSSNAYAIDRLFESVENEKAE